MSRSAAKSRDKSRAASLVLAPALPRPASVQNVETVDIVPGRLTEAAWVTMTTQDNGEEVVAEIMGELEAAVMDRCYQVYLQKQVCSCHRQWHTIWGRCRQRDSAAG